MFRTPDFFYCPPKVKSSEIGKNDMNGIGTTPGQNTRRMHTFIANITLKLAECMPKMLNCEF